jgi:hypothetical protein
MASGSLGTMTRRATISARLRRLRESVKVSNLISEGLQLAGFACIIAASWQVSEVLGLALAGVALVFIANTR